MSNALMMRYAATRSPQRSEPMHQTNGDEYRRMGTEDRSGGRRMGDYDGAESRYERQPVHYAEDPYHDWPRDNAEMRQRRDERGRYMTYDGDNGGRTIGFGRMDMQELQSRPKPRHMVANGGRFVMQNDDDDESSDKLTRDAAQAWVDSMEWTDQMGKPMHGGKWSMAEVKPFAGRMGVPIDGEDFYEFFAMMNAMYADYMPVAKKYGISSPEFYAGMAKAFIDDEDAVDGKVARYRKYIAKR